MEENRDDFMEQATTEENPYTEPYNETESVQEENTMNDMQMHNEEALEAVIEPVVAETPVQEAAPVQSPETAPVQSPETAPVQSPETASDVKDTKKAKAKKEKREKKGGVAGLLVKAAAVALVFGLISGGCFYGIGFMFDTLKASQGTTSQTTGQDTTIATTTINENSSAVASDVADIAEEVMPAIVAITNLTVSEVKDYWSGKTYSYESASCGSGIIVAQSDTYLYIATNNHVVSGATTLTVCFVDDETVSAEIKGTDSSTDLAVIMVKISDIPSATLSAIKVATLGDSDALRVGETAIAIGNALGYGQSVTVGCISALNREVSITDSDGNTITNALIQTDAAINPGNSGGALINANGEVIGINSAKYSDTDVEGMGFAIPMSTAAPIIDDLISREVVDEENQGYLGISGVDVTETVSSYYNIPIGFYVSSVLSGSAAEAAGVQQGDVLVAFDGTEITCYDELSNNMQYYAAGTTNDIVVKRQNGGEWSEITLTVTLGSKN